MKNKKKIIFIGLIIAILGALYIWQSNNIKSAIEFVSLSKDEIVNKMDTNKKNTTALLDQYVAVSFRELTKEEEQQLEKGEVTPDEIVDRIVKESEETNKDKVVTDKPKLKSEHQAEIDKAVGTYVTKMYATKSYYLGVLDGMQGKIYADFNALPEDQRNESGKQALIKKYLGYAADAEKNCDKQVNDVLAALKADLTTYNGDMEIISILKKAYDDEKALKKAYYMNKLKE